MRMRDNGKATSTGMSLSGTLLVLFIVLKLLGVIKWSWFWVLSPLWIDFVVVGLFLFCVYVVPKIIRFFKEIYK